MNIYKQLRKEKNLTQLQLATQLSIRQSTVSAWEIGKSIPDYCILIKLADIYNCSIDYLLGREDDFGNVNISEPIKNELNADEKELISIFKLLNAERKERLINLAKDYLELCKNEKNYNKFNLGEKK